MVLILVLCVIGYLVRQILTLLSPMARPENDQPFQAPIAAAAEYPGQELVALLPSTTTLSPTSIFEKGHLVFLFLAGKGTFFSISILKPHCELN